jgi:hypothetical protein
MAFTLPLAAQPTPGSWKAPDDFPAGTWEEILWGGSEGAPGNEITALSPGLFAFQGALLDEVVLVTEPSWPDTPYYQYETTYLGGEVTLANLPDAPWYNECDPGTRLPANLRRTTVTTWKYIDETGQATGEMAFRLDTVVRFTGHPKYGAHITAGFRGVPAVGGTGTPEDPITIGGELTHVHITILGPLTVSVDVKPGSCPNPINCKSRGVVPVAIAGDGSFDVHEIDLRSIRLAGIPPVRFGWEDVTTPYIPDCVEPDEEDCMMAGPDGVMDLTLKFSTMMLCRVLRGAEDGDVILLPLTATLKDGTEIKGADVVRIMKKGHRRPPRP